MDQSFLESIIRRHGFGSVVSVRQAQLTPTIGADATSKTFYVQTETHELLVKCADPKTLAVRTPYHRAIAPYLPLPRILADGEGYQILEWIAGAQPLLSLVLEGQADALAWYRKAAECLSALWGTPTDQKSKGGSSGHHAKNLKASTKLAEYLSVAYDVPVVLNGTDTCTSVRSIFETTLRILGAPAPFPCATHGDPRLDNILVHPERGVIFIDARPGFYDWLDDMVLFAWQRGFKIVEFATPPTMQISADALEIMHEATWPAFVDQAEAEALQVAEKFAKAQRDNGWRKRYHYMVAACALREIVSIQRRRKLGALGRELPDGAEGFWIAEAIKYFNAARET